MPLLIDVRESMSDHSASLTSQLDSKKIPSHIALIPDGNRRWAKKEHKPFFSGHQKGASIVLEIVKQAQALGISALTIYTFSTENWNRSPSEVQALMALLTRYLKKETAAMVAHNIRLHTIGNLEPLPKSTQAAIKQAKEATLSCTGIDFILAINYGGRDEMMRAIKKVASDLAAKRISLDNLDESLFSSYLDTGRWQEPELLIRTSGEQRLSNFLLWQIPYTEIYFSPVLWPDFTPKHLVEAIIEYQRRQKRLGG